jgi:TatD DNase family protein
MYKGIFDTHTHLNDPWYKKEGLDSSEILERSKKVGVSYFCNVGFDIKSSAKAIQQAAKYHEVYAAVGIHPNEAHKVDVVLDSEEIDTLANGNKVVAIGEIGLDYYHDGQKYKDVQIELFKAQLDIANKHDLPVSLHIRDIDGSIQAYEDALEILIEKKVKSGIVHCYTQGPELARRFIEHGFYISIPGIVTFSSAKDLHETVKDLSLNSMLLETDAPYLTPSPMRGKINTSEYIVYTAEYVAKLKKTDVQDVISATATNAKKVFKL